MTSYFATATSFSGLLTTAIVTCETPDKLVIQWHTWTLGMDVWGSGTILENHK